MKQLILASRSPRRKQLLNQIGLTFTVHPSEIEEILSIGLNPLQQVEELSRQKAEEVSKKFQNAIILAADTMVVAENEMLGKPQDAKEATKMLQKLSGKVHSIVTGFTLIDTDTKQVVTNSTETKVWFRKLTNEEISAYLEKDKPFDKAGAYAIQEVAAVFVEKTEGDYLGAIGLPVFLVAKELKKFGMSVL